MARIAGVEDQVGKITAAAMRGEIDFAESLRSRCALLKGAKADDLFKEVGPFQVAESSPTWMSSFHVVVMSVDAKIGMYEERRIGF